MGKPELAEALKEAGIVINIRGLNKQQLLRGVAALIEGGIKPVELPYTTIMSVGHPALREKGLLVGIGTVTYSTHAREAGTFGADFFTASVTTPGVVLACEQMSIPCILSSLTPTEIRRAHEIEADFVKVTAAEALGGPPYIRSLRESLPAVRLVGAKMPSDGGYLSYLEAGIEVLEFKSSLAFPELIERGRWAEISRRAAEIVETRDNWRANHTQPYN